MAAHQTEARAGPVNKTNIIPISAHVDVRNFFVEFDGIRYPKNAIDFQSEKKSQLKQKS